MKKLFSLALLVTMIVSSLGLVNTFASEIEPDQQEIEPRGCSSWSTYDTWDYCDTSDHCGFLQKDSTNILKRKQERYCRIGGRQVRETRVTSKKDGCC